AAAPGRGAARPIQSAFAPSGGGIGSFKVFYVQYAALVDLGGVRAGLDGRAIDAAPDPRRMARRRRRVGSQPEVPRRQGGAHERLRPPGGPDRLGARPRAAALLVDVPLDGPRDADGADPGSD